jgi:hypothetical protein
LSQFPQNTTLGVGALAGFDRSGALWRAGEVSGFDGAGPLD